MMRLRIVIPALLVFASPAAWAADPVAGIYSVRTPAGVTAQIPYTTVIEPGDGQNTIEVLLQPDQPPDHGSVSYPAIYSGAGQNFSYTPDAGYVGLDSFYYKVTDQDGGVSFGLISINVGNVAAVAGDDDLVVEPDVMSFLDVLVTDTGFADPVTFSITQQPSHGSLTFDVPVPLPGPFWQSLIGVFYTPDPGYTGTDQFQYQISDSIDQDSATVRLTVSPDTDGDGLLDYFDNCPAAANPGQEDGDTDGVGNACDNCTLVANADQRDTNGDGYGNMCDADLNNSGGVVNFTDLALFRAAFGSTTNADADFNGNGSVNFTDLALFRNMFGKLPGPSALSP